MKPISQTWGWVGREFDEKKMILMSIISQIRAGDGKVEVDFIL